MPTTRIADLIDIASGLSGLAPELIRGKSRLQHIARVRMATVYAAHLQQVHSSCRIGKVFGRDHSTILHSIKMVPEYMRRSPEYTQFVWAILAEAYEARPFLEIERPVFAFPAKPSEGKLVYRKRPIKQIYTPVCVSKRPILPTDAPPNDSGVKFHNDIGGGSAKLLKALRAA